LTNQEQRNIINPDLRRQTASGRLQIGTLAGFRSEQVAGFLLECMAGFVGIRSKAVFADGALPAKMKQIIAVAVAHVTQCPYCIKGHTRAALHAGATPQELMEAIWVAAEMRAGGAYAHSALMLDTLNAGQAKA
jgi:AhpD family alkylhydroperoxidase